MFFAYYLYTTQWDSSNKLKLESIKQVEILNPSNQLNPSNRKLVGSISVGFIKSDQKQLDPLNRSLLQKIRVVQMAFKQFLFHVRICVQGSVLDPKRHVWIQSTIFGFQVAYYSLFMNNINSISKCVMIAVDFFLFNFNEDMLFAALLFKICFCQIPFFVAINQYLLYKHLGTEIKHITKVTMQVKSSFASFERVIHMPCGVMLFEFCS